MNIHPIATIENGNIAILGKERGLTKTLEKVLGFAKESNIDLDLPIQYGYTYSFNVGVEIRDYFIKNGFSNADISSIGCVIGTHGGPKAGGIGFIKKQKQ